MRTKPFQINSIYATLFVASLLIWLTFGFESKGQPSDPPPSNGELILLYVCIVAAWPFFLAAKFLHHFPPLGPTLLLLVFAGVSWSMLLEMVFNVRQRKAVTLKL